ncbi:site-specific DNA-methyltransferase [Phenylobacterium sp.]|uniref:site-specific DNA-methyltransferase n=1 Tax=Phenylobacterium sp. TaxID=1871053 RepID=UPI002733304C|nr:site-specific DNA-methyltransferase [Phenylobacterium sp.]MDP3595114.1 site-specific DNA-methyltransferase [Phenylobacterium sp.]
MSTKTKLELTWIGKEHRPRLEPRILIEDESLSHHASARRDGDHFDNILIHGDNLLALKALEASYTGLVKCVFIDPPYNTFSAIPNYEDGLEHSLWLSLMRERLQLLRNLMSDDGSIWIAIDDNEFHYLKVLCDEIFGRSNFFASIVWQHSVQGKNDAKTVSLHHNYILVYQKSPSFERNKLPRKDEHNVNYANPDNDPKGMWRSGDVRSPNYRENLRYSVTTPSGKKIPAPEKGWRWSQETFAQKVKSGEITFVNNEERVLRKIYLSEQDGRVPESIWFGDEVGTTREATNELRSLLGDREDLFPTPKPERLVERILRIATQPGDLVLDSFAGSGTTGAVAHKMGRRWIMVELGEHCESHVVPRLTKVIDGDDAGGITEAAEWKGGGGYRYFRMAPSLLEKDQFGQWVISKAYNPEMLAEAMCKQFGFTYGPSDEHYWLHGHSSETDFIYVTTNSLTHEQLQAISDEVGEDRTLLICCKAFQGTNADKFSNLTIRKIPGAILDRCEWGKDDYSLKIEALPLIEDEPETEPEPDATVRSRGRPRKADDAPSLFDAEGDA